MGPHCGRTYREQTVLVIAAQEETAVDEKEDYDNIENEDKFEAKHNYKWGIGVPFNHS